MKQILSILIIACCFLTVKAQNIEGVWYNTTKTGKVEIYKTGSKYFGKIIWLDEPNYEATGKPKVDENNPESELQKTPIMGLVVLKGFKNDGAGKYSDGTIYDPENGKTYKCKMTQIDNDHLDVRGYIGFPALGRTENWTRASK